MSPYHVVSTHYEDGEVTIIIGNSKDPCWRGEIKLEADHIRSAIRCGELGDWFETKEYRLKKSEIECKEIKNLLKSSQDNSQVPREEW